MGGKGGDEGEEEEREIIKEGRWKKMRDLHRGGWKRGRVIKRRKERVEDYIVRRSRMIELQMQAINVSIPRLVSPGHIIILTSANRQGPYHPVRELNP